MGGHPKQPLKFSPTKKSLKIIKIKIFKLENKLHELMLHELYIFYAVQKRKYDISTRVIWKLLRYEL